MFVSIQSNSTISSTALPEDRQGGHWLVNGEKCKIAFAEACVDGWKVTPCVGYTLRGSRDTGDREAFLVPYDRMTIFTLCSEESEEIVVCRPSTDFDKTSSAIGFSSDVDITIGRSRDNVLVYGSQFVSSHHACIALRAGAFFIIDMDSSNGVFVNGKRLRKNEEYSLSSGDIITILGLVITIGNRFISFNNPQGLVSMQSCDAAVVYQPHDAVDLSRDNHFENEEFFYPALRFARSIERKNFIVDSPPQREQQDETPIAMRIGPSLVMALASVMSASVSIMYIVGQGSNIWRAIPMVAMAVAMLTGSVLWPMLNKKYQNKKFEFKEGQRRSAYAQYLNGLRTDLYREMQLQKEILIENRVSAHVCIEHATEVDEFLMSRTSLHRDYLELRVGIGNEDLCADVRFPDVHFTVEEDDLRSVVESFSKEPRILENVPLSYSLISSPILGVVGVESDTDAFVRQLIIQIATLHSYEDVKIVLMCDDEQKDSWRFVSYLPHCFDNKKVMRYYSTTLESANVLGMLLERELANRCESERFDARNARPYYVVICPSKRVYDKVGALRDILELKDNKGFAFIACARQLHELPRQCKSVIGIEGASGFQMDRDDPSGKKKFFALDKKISISEANKFATIISAVELDIQDTENELPERLGFLEMFDVKNVEHLNIAARWRTNNTSETLAAVVGRGTAGEPFVLNLHEDYHGPHGLIAGTTGSGKSEFIITYVLSMAVNYSPEEVAFVLIDYKGGGLARAFENSRVTLPHLAGTITNLDGAAITRSLTSIQSELKRRQALFNAAREVTGGDNVDIYRYLDLYRQGQVKEPCPHLILIADEFAELKQQEPDFMDELISAARIGRSLGVHLVLATQKPSGVVNDQIWSNSRFKISLKVADAADSQEIIRRPDAAEITQTGRFFLMVGYNEYFAMGQSGYTGVAYDPNASAGDTTSVVEYVSDTGRALLSVKPQLERDESIPIESEIVVLLQHIEHVALEQEIHAKKLWLEPIPNHITLGEVCTRFSDISQNHQVLMPIVGIYDDPAHQRQELLALPLLEEGNAIIYGTSDSGVEQILQSMLLSLVKSQTASDFNAYIFDFGTQALTAFAKAPQVGDIILVDDEEKVRRFFTFIHDVITKRRALFAPYGGSYVRYSEKNEGCPAILIVLNDVAAFFETYEHYEDSFVSFVRESAQVGIRVVMTADTVSSVRMRLRSNFRQVLACDLADPSDYLMLFGSMHGVPKPHGFGRGLVRIEESVFEFQSASVCAEDQSAYDYIQQVCLEVEKQEQGDFAPSVPLAPEYVETDISLEYKDNPLLVPIGVFDDNLHVATLDYADSPLSRCVFQKRKEGVSFLTAFMESVSLVEERDTVLLDTAAYLEKKPAECAFATQKSDRALNYIKKLMDDRCDASRPVLLVFTGAVDFLNSCSSSDATTIRKYLANLRAGGVVMVLLVDSSSAATPTYEDWFKTHLTNRDGLWVGSGADSQNSINALYNAKFIPDSQMNAKKGYLIEGGSARLVHLVSKKESKR